MEVPRHVTWTTGLFDCLKEPGICCFSCCCPCITFGWNAEIVDRGRPSCVVSGLILYCMSMVGCGCLYSHTYRNKLRGLYNLQEKPCMDCCVHCWCGYCALCQEYRELRNRGWEPSIGWAGQEERMKSSVQLPPHAVPGMSR